MSAPSFIEVTGRRIGAGAPCFVIAEAGVNHNGDMALARKLVDAAKAAGADAVKFQTFKATKLVSAQAPKAAYQMRTTDTEESQFEMIRRLELSPEAHRELIDYCDQKGIVFLSSPFDEGSADFLRDLDVPLLKIPSGEVINLPYLAHLAGLGKPLILSTGMSTLGEVEAAVRTIRENGDPPLVLLHCVTNYPTDPAEVNLRAMATMACAFRVPVGYSDHVPPNEVSLAAVALGACVVEKHFTLDRTLPGPDHQASLEPNELKELVDGIRRIEAALGDGVKQPAPSEKDNIPIVRKSLVTARDLPAGTVLQKTDLIGKRPGTGLSPALLDMVLGRTLRTDLPQDSLLSLEDLQ